MHRLALLGAVWLLSCEFVRAEVLEKGRPIDSAIRAMEAASYRPNNLAMGPPTKDEDLRFWDVNQGVLIIYYSKITNKITGMRYDFAGELPKQRRLAFDVVRFDTDSGEVTIRTRKSKPVRNNKPSGGLPDPKELPRTKP